MLFVCANWGITDGSLGTAGGGTATAWLERIRRAVLRHGFGRDGRYRPTASIDVILAGDSFDHLTSAAWTGAVRPWHRSAKAAALRAQVAAASIREGRSLLGGLARWSRRGLTVPASDGKGRPLLSTAVRTEVRVTLLAGDRDPGIEAAAGELGRFGFFVGRVWGDDLVTVRHGAELDPLCGSPSPCPGGSDRPPTIQESLLVDLVAWFGACLRQEGYRPERVGPLVGRLAGGRLLEMPAVVAGFCADPVSEAGGSRPGSRDPTHRCPGTSPGPREAWRRAVDRWHSTALASRPVSGLGYCVLDTIAAWLAAPVGGEAGQGRRDGPAPLPAPEFRMPKACRSGLPSGRCEVLGHLPAGFVQEGRDLRLPVVCLGGWAGSERPLAAAGDSAARTMHPGVGTAACRGVTMVGTNGPGGGIVWQPLADSHVQHRSRQREPAVVEAA